MKKRVFVAHPVSGDVAENLCKIEIICEELHRLGQVIPVAPYLVSLRYLDDSIITDRDLGIETNQAYFLSGFVDELWLFGDRVSSGMKSEICLALQCTIPVVPKTKETRFELNHLCERLAKSAPP